LIGKIPSDRTFKNEVFGEATREMKSGREEIILHHTASAVDAVHLLKANSFCENELNATWRKIDGVFNCKPRLHGN
jgi:hypothetical protein